MWGDMILTNVGYLFDLYKNEKGVYSASLIPGDYILNAFAPGCKELSEYLSAAKGESKVEFTLAKKVAAQLTISAVDVVSGAPISGALLKV